MAKDGVTLGCQAKDMAHLLDVLMPNATNHMPLPLKPRRIHLLPHVQFCKPTLLSILARDIRMVVQICGTCIWTGPVCMIEMSRTYRCLARGCCVTLPVCANFGTANNALPQLAVCLGPIIARCARWLPLFALVAEGPEHANYQGIEVHEKASALDWVGSVLQSILFIFLFTGQSDQNSLVVEQWGVLCL